MQYNEVLYSQCAGSVCALEPYYPRLRYDPDKERSLVFIDTRFRAFFRDLFVTFLASVDHRWNLTVLCPEEVWRIGFSPMLAAMGVEARHIPIRPQDVMPIRRYSEFVTRPDFYRVFPEKTILLFQSDSQAMGAFREAFTRFPYLGAPWKNGRIGNGGTSVRDTRALESLCRKYDGKIPRHPEDVFFSRACAREGWVTGDTARAACGFSIEATLPPGDLNPVYGHCLWLACRERSRDYFAERLEEWTRSLLKENGSAQEDLNTR